MLSTTAVTQVPPNGSTSAPFDYGSAASRGSSELRTVKLDEQLSQPFAYGSIQVPTELLAPFSIIANEAAIRNHELFQLPRNPYLQAPIENDLINSPALEIFSEFGLTESYRELMYWVIPVAESFFEAPPFWQFRFGFDRIHLLDGWHQDGADRMLLTISGMGTIGSLPQNGTPIDYDPGNFRDRFPVEFELLRSFSGQTYINGEDRKDVSRAAATEWLFERTTGRPSGNLFEVPAGELIGIRGLNQGFWHSAPSLLDALLKERLYAKGEAPSVEEVTAVIEDMLSGRQTIEPRLLLVMQGPPQRRDFSPLQP